MECVKGKRKERPYRGLSWVFCDLEALGDEMGRYGVEGPCFQGWSIRVSGLHWQIRCVQSLGVHHECQLNLSI